MVENVLHVLADGAAGGRFDLLVAGVDIHALVGRDGADHFAERGDNLLVAI